jgi:hypothetical protein
MLYRAIFGIVPMILIALFATGAIPLSSVMPTGEYRSSAVRKAQGDNGNKARPARTAEGRVSQGLGLISAEDISMMEDNMQAVEEMHKAAEDIDEKRKLEARTPGWAPKSGGWGR